MPLDCGRARRIKVPVEVTRHVGADLAASPVMNRHRIEHRNHLEHFDHNGDEKDSRGRDSASGHALDRLRRGEILVRFPHPSGAQVR